MAEFAGIAVACLLGSGLVAWLIVDGIVENKERARCRDLFVPIIGAEIRLVGQLRTKRYQITGDYRGHTVSVHCPVASLFGRSLQVLSLSIAIDETDLDPELSSGNFIQRRGRTFRKYGGDLRLLVSPPLVFGPHASRESFLSQISAELDILCEVAAANLLHPAPS